MMEMSLSRPSFSGYVQRLLASHLPDREEMGGWSDATFGRALERCEYSFSKIARKYYQHDGKVVFDHLNADHMATFLYFLGNTHWSETGEPDLPTRLSYLNKIMHGLDLFYSVKMPDIFLLVHPLGTVLGNASYGDYLVIYQNCTVGAVSDIYPVFGTGTILYSRSSVLGASRSGDDVVFAANSAVVDVDVPKETVVVGVYPNHRLLPNQSTVRQRCFDAPSRG